MRRALIGVLLAATVAAPALADKGGGGHGRGNGGGGKAAHQGRQGNGGGHEFRGRQDFRPQGRASAERPQMRGPRADFASRGNGNGNGKGKSEWKREARAERAFVSPRAQHQPSARDWGKRKEWKQREARFDRPVRVVRFDDKQARKAWKRQAKEERKFQRALARQDRFRPAERWVSAAPVVRYDRRPIYDRPVVRYVAPRVVRYAPVYASYAPAMGWAGDDWWPEDDYGYSSYGYGYRSIAPLAYGYDPYGYGGDRYAYDRDDAYGYYGTGYDLYDSVYPSYGEGLFNGGDGLMATLLPVLLQSVLGGDAGLGGLGGLGGLNGLGGLGGLGGYDNGINVLPLQEASYAPYLTDGNDLSSLLLPAVLGRSFF